MHLSAIRRLLADGAVRVDGMPCAQNVRLAPGAVVEVAWSGAERAWRRADRNGELPRVLASGDGWLVLDKPAGLLTVPDRAGREDSVHSQLPRLRPDADLRPDLRPDLRIVHRLDRDTSGCLLVADGLAAARHFDLEFRAGRVHKQYLALVHGALATPRRTIELPLAPDPRRPGCVRVARRGERGARDARTEVEVEAEHGAFALVRLSPATGRSHQLRAHLAAIGHPIVGDADYGGRPLLLSELKRGYKLRPGRRERAVLERTFLHAALLEFAGPDGAEVAVRSPLPADLAAALARVARVTTART
jgi:RluA family pseudouridine synthase